MRQNLLQTIFLTIIVFGSTVPEKKCAGTKNVMDLPDECTEIDENTLTISGKIDDALLREKLKHVKIIKRGLRVENTDIDDFSHFPEATDIQNPDGPALFFKGNSVLKRILFSKLLILKGKEYEVEFENDNFPKAAFEEQEAMRHLLNLEALSRGNAVRARDKCSPVFMKVSSETVEEGSNWPFYALLAFNAFLFVVICVLVFFLWKHKSDLKNDKNNVKNGKKKDDKKKEKGKEKPKEQ